MTELAAHLDVETRSAADLKKTGAARYFEHPTTSVTLFSYCIGDGPMQRWRPGDPAPSALLEHIGRGGRVVAHNAGFERLAWAWIRKNLHPEWPSLTIGHQDCTMARGRALALPGRLEDLAPALELDVRKDAEGHRLMMQMSRPRGFTACDGEPFWWDDAERLDRLHAYCDQDVRTEAGIDGKIPHLSASERRVWMLDQHINDRGFPVDLQRASRALACVAEATTRAGRTLWRLTDGAIDKVSQAARIVSWINARGVPCTSVADGEIDDLVERCRLFGDEAAEKVARLRQASAVTFKFEAILTTASSDGRIRGSLAYHGTLNGRWAGRGVQPHNFKRLDTDEDIEAARICVDILGMSLSPSEMVDLIEDFTGRPALEVLSLCARSMIAAPAGRQFYGGDFSNIEGRTNAWLAGEAWKLEAFRAYDAKTGPDLYRVMAGRALGKATDAVTKEDRQLWGKVPELACGYQGGVHAFNKMGAKYGVRVEEKHAKGIVQGWREENPRIVQLWRDLQDAAIDACANPDLVVPVAGGRVKYRCSHGFLWCSLPSGRVIAYPRPSVKRRHRVVMIDGDPVEFNNWGVTYWGEKKGYREIDLYGGAQCAHVVSGAARDILVGSMFRLEAAGYPLVLTVHDENLSEVAEGFGSVDDYLNRMAEADAWTAGLPIAVSAWKDVRYVK